MGEEVPANLIQDAVIQFMRGREDAVVFGAQAVNIYVSPQRATEDVDIAALDAPSFAEELKQYINKEFFIAVRVRSVRGGIGYRIYQVRKSGNRHLVDVRPVQKLPPRQMVEDVAVIKPEEAIANKVMSVQARGNKEKGMTDTRDLMGLLRTFPELKTTQGPVHDRLIANNASPEVFTLWQEWVDRVLEPEDEDDEFDF
jgi:hypothetical protein